MKIFCKTWIFGVLLIVPLFYSCEKDNEVGKELIDKDLLISVVTDSIVNISMTTEFDTEIRSSRFSYMLGSYEDPITGNHAAGFLTRFYYENLSKSLENVDVDSIVLVMYDTSFYYGNKEAYQEILIAEITESLTRSHFENYYNKAQLPESVIESAREIAVVNYRPQLSADKGFKFALPEAYATELFNRIKQVYVDTVQQRVADSLLIEEFKGLYVSVPFSDAAIVRYVSPHIIIYMTGTDGSQKTFQLQPSTVLYTSESTSDPSLVYVQPLNIFKHEFSEKIEESIGDNSKTEFYIKGNAGLKVVLDLHEIESWRDSSAIINIARLHVPIANTNDSNEYPLPPVLNLRIYDAEGDLFYTTLSVFNDSYEYIFNCHQFIVKMLQSSDDITAYSFELSVPDNNIYTHRLVINGEEKPRLVLTYTK